MKSKQVAFGLLMMAAPFSVFASNMDKNIINIHSQVQAEVEPDVLTVRLQARAESLMPLEADEMVNKSVQDFLQTLNGYESIDVSIFNHRTYLDKRRDSRGEALKDYWVATADILLTGKHKAEIASAVMNTPESITSKGASFSISAEKANSLQNDLMTQAIAEFQTKAYSVTKQFGFNCYDVVNLSVNDHQVGTTSMKRPTEMMVMSADMTSRRSTAPSYEGGEQTLSVSVNGSVQMHERQTEKCWIIN